MQNNRGPTISVVIPTYNRAGRLTRAIDSVLAQSRPVDEIIVVDDGSADETATVVQAYGPPVRYIWQENTGPAAARNRGIAEARGTWIAFLDSDDRWFPDKMARQMAVLDAYPQLRWCGGEIVMVKRDREYVRPLTRQNARTLSKHGFFPCFLTAFRLGCDHGMTCAMVIHREVFGRVGCFDPALPYSGEDGELWFRIACVYPAIGWLHDPVFYCHNDSPDGLHAPQTHQMWCSVLSACWRNVTSISGANPRLLRPIMRDKSLVSALKQLEAGLGSVTKSDVTICRDLLRMFGLSRLLIAGLDALPECCSRRIAARVLVLRQVWLRHVRDKRSWEPAR